VLVVPRPFPIPTAFSPGDLLVAAGIFILLQRTMLGSSTPQTMPGRPCEMEKISECVFRR